MKLIMKFWCNLIWFFPLIFLYPSPEQWMFWSNWQNVYYKLTKKYLLVTWFSSKSPVGLERCRDKYTSNIKIEVWNTKARTCCSIWRLKNGSSNYNCKGIIGINNKKPDIWNTTMIYYFTWKQQAFKKGLLNR